MTEFSPLRQGIAKESVGPEYLSWGVGEGKRGRESEMVTVTRHTQQ